MTTQASPSPAAIRSKRYRERVRDGVLIAPVSVYEEDLDFLVQTGIIEDCDLGDRARIASAIEELLTWLGAGAFILDEEALDRVLQADDA